MTKIFDKPSNPMEQEIADYIKPLLTPEVEEKIKKDKLTLKGCLEHCHKKGKKFEVKSGNTGFAMVTPEQHFKWVREYFGITDEAAATAPIHIHKPDDAAQQRTVAKGALDIDIDSLFDF